MRIAIAADHAAFALKDRTRRLAARAEGHEVIDLGTERRRKRRLSAIMATKLADAIAAGRADRGVALCGSGIGIAIAANRHPACRCARCREPLSARSPASTMTATLSPWAPG